MIIRHLVSATALLTAGAAVAQTKVPAGALDQRVFAAAAAVQPKVVNWRRDIHQHPELSTQEVRTARLVADHLRKLGYEVRSGVAGTGVIGVLKGASPGRTVALRADMDALPVAEQTGLPFASKVTAQWKGATVPVMHACGHDSHVAMLMGAAEVLASMKSSINGTVILIFQPAEEGAPGTEKAGAPLIVEERALTPVPDAIFGIHVVPGPAGRLMWRSGPFMAGSDTWEIHVTGRQTHGSAPWQGVDAASFAADIVQSFNQISARQVNVPHAPTVLSVGEIHLGQRHNIIPGAFDMTGTLRTFDTAMRKDVIARIEKTLAAIGAQYDAKVEMRWIASNPVTVNTPALTNQLRPAMARAAKGSINDGVDFVMGSEDFSAYSAVAPTLFVHLGVGADTPPNHSPNFAIDEAVMEVGVRAYVFAALDVLEGAASVVGQ